MNKYSLYFDDMQQVWDLYKGEFDNKEFVRSYKTKRNAMNRVKAIALKEETALTLFVGYKDKNGNVVNEDYSINGESATQLSKDTYTQEQVSAANFECAMKKHEAESKEYVFRVCGEKTCVYEQEESASNQTDLSEVSKVSQIVGEALYSINKAKRSVAHIGEQGGEAQEHAQTQRVERGIARVRAQSPPLANRGGATKTKDQ